MSANTSSSKRRARKAAAAASQSAAITRSSNPLHAWVGAKLVLKNESDYRVSNWVVHEDKLSAAAAVGQRVFRNIEDQLNDGGADPINAKQNAKHGWDVINAEQALDDEVRKKEALVVDSTLPLLSGVQTAGHRLNVCSISSSPFLSHACLQTARFFAAGKFTHRMIRDPPHQFFVLRDERLKVDGPVTKVPFPKGCRQLRVYTYAWFEKDKEWRVIRDKVCTYGRRRKTYTLMVTNQMVEPFELLSAGGLE